MSDADEPVCTGSAVPIDKRSNKTSVLAFGGLPVPKNSKIKSNFFNYRKEEIWN